MKKCVLVILVLAAFGLSGFAHAGILYTNDFGTQAQRDEWDITGGSVSYNESSSFDLDGDTLGAEVCFQTGGESSRYLVLELNAPEGMGFSNLVVSGTGYGSRNAWSTYTYLQMSVDGENWEVYSGFPREVNGYYSLVSDSTGISNFQNLETVYLRVTMSAYTNNYLPKFKELTVEGDLAEVPEPASLLLLACGAVGFMKRKR